jgi:hypothetical protein
MLHPEFIYPQALVSMQQKIFRNGNQWKNHLYAIDYLGQLGQAPRLTTIKIL